MIPTYFSCVRTGTGYGFEYVIRLHDALRRNTSGDMRLLNFTDQPEEYPGVIRVDISKHGLKGWWGKIALFNPLYQPFDGMIYFDLDTAITGNIDEMVKAAKAKNEFIILRDFLYYKRLAENRNPNPKDFGYGSAIMHIPQGFGRKVWDDFMADRDTFMTKYEGVAGGGDQAFIHDTIGPDALLWQDMVSDKDYFRSFKFPVSLMNELPPKTRVVCFHGYPKPHEATKCSWLERNWY
jgi:hypothetical protein